MTRGLVIGKFMPVHLGHVALIEFAAAQCDELIVSMSFTTLDPIPPTLRFQWLQQLFHDRRHIKIYQVEDDFDDESLPLSERTKLWSDFIRKIYPSIDKVFSSEEYGGPFAAHLNAQHVAFDHARKNIPVSATSIRQQPLMYWDFIPAIVRPYFVKKICFFGPESTGKSTLAKVMAQRYQTTFVPEVARELLTSNDFSLDDIIRIGHAQRERVEAALQTSNKLLFCDTDAITTEIYSQYYLKAVPEIIYELENEVVYDHYFLFDIDVPWVADGLRDLGQKRKEMFQLFQSALDQRRIAYTIVRGDYATRQRTIEQWIAVNFSITPTDK